MSRPSPDPSRSAHLSSISPTSTSFNLLKPSPVIRIRATSRSALTSSTQWGDINTQHYCPAIWKSGSSDCCQTHLGLTSRSRFSMPRCHLIRFMKPCHMYGAVQIAHKSFTSKSQRENLTRNLIFVPSLEAMSETIRETPH